MCVSYSHFRGTALVEAFGWWMLSFGVHTPKQHVVCLSVYVRTSDICSFYLSIATSTPPTPPPPWASQWEQCLCTHDTLIPQLITSWLFVPLVFKHRQCPLLILVGTSYSFYTKCSFAINLCVITSDLISFYKRGVYHIWHLLDFNPSIINLELNKCVLVFYHFCFETGRIVLQDQGKKKQNKK